MMLYQAEISLAIILLFVTQEPLADHDLLIVVTLQSHSDAPHSVGLL
jgi:hypothetical protein